MVLWKSLLHASGTDLADGEHRLRARSLHEPLTSLEPCSQDSGNV